MTPLEENEDAWPDEPTEFDPDSIGPDPPDPPDATSGSEEALRASESVPDGVFRAFWASVLLLNVALAALSIGAMLIYFQGDYETGTLTFLIGAVAAFGTIRYYWGVKTGRYADGSRVDGTDGDRTNEPDKGDEPGSDSP